MAKKLLVSELTNTIYLADAKQIGDSPQQFVVTGEKQDYTDEAIKAVFEWFLHNCKDDGKSDEGYQVKFKGIPYVLQMIPIQGEGSDE